MDAKILEVLQKLRTLKIEPTGPHTTTRDQRIKKHAHLVMQLTEQASEISDIVKHRLENYLTAQGDSRTCNEGIEGKKSLLLNLLMNQSVASVDSGFARGFLYCDQLVEISGALLETNEKIRKEAADVAILNMRVAQAENDIKTMKEQLENERADHRDEVHKIITGIRNLKENNLALNRSIQDLETCRGRTEDLNKLHGHLIDTIHQLSRKRSSLQENLKFKVTRGIQLKHEFENETTMWTSS